VTGSSVNAVAASIVAITVLIVLLERFARCKRDTWARVVSFLRRWLGVEKKRVGLRPHRDLQLCEGIDAAYARVLEAIEVTLGANVTIDDRAGLFIEAGFGLVNSERIRCSFDARDPADTRVRIEAIYPAASEIPERSRAVEALYTALIASNPV
jgi:hypothetical protein